MTAWLRSRIARFNRAFASDGNTSLALVVIFALAGLIAIEYAMYR